MTTTDESSRSRGPLGPILLPWILAGLVDAVIAGSAYAPPAPWQFALEFVVLAGMGWAQWTFARGWLRSPLLAAGLLAVFGALPHTPSGAGHAIPFLLGITIPIVLATRWAGTGRAVAAPVAAVVAAVIVAIVHVIDYRSLESATSGFATSLPEFDPAATGNAVDGPPIVVISVDTLRADAASTMKSVARLSAIGASWPRAMSTSSWTLPALASLQTGLMPAEHGAGCLEDGHCQGLLDSVPTLAEELRSGGWTTAAIVANPWAGPGMGFARGFSRFIDPGQPGRRLLIGGTPSGPHGQDDVRTVDAAIEWLDDAPARGFYLWVHLMGPHMPYLHSTSEKMRRLDPVALRSSYPPSAEQRKEIRDAYDGQVAYTDVQVMRLLDAMESRGILGEGVVVFTSDHGEEFWDHGLVEHGHSHHGEVIDVPLVVVAPGVAPAVRSGVASLVDIAPTIRTIAGLEARGIDLRHGPPPERIATAWGGIILRLDCSARDSAARLLDRDCSADLAKMRLFDLAKDPNELLPAKPDDNHPLVGVAREINAPPVRDAVPVSSDRLRALGYLQ